MQFVSQPGGQLAESLLAPCFKTYIQNRMLRRSLFLFHVAALDRILFSCYSHSIFADVLDIRLRGRHPEIRSRKFEFEIHTRARRRRTYVDVVITRGSMPAPARRCICILYVKPAES